MKTFIRKKKSNYRSRINFLLELPLPSVDFQDRIGFVNHFSVFSLIRAFLEGNVILC